MDSSNLLTFLVCVVISAFSIQATVGSIACENLNKDSCAFAVHPVGSVVCLRRAFEEAGKSLCQTQGDNKRRGLSERLGAPDSLRLDPWSQ
ncbi:hypothetical protein Tco_0411386 [Tanacetum coccineum]